MNDDLRDLLNIRYTKLHFDLVLVSDCTLPVFKSSALRGGIGEMLLRANCVRDRNCDVCDFRKECIVQRTMYSQFDFKPGFITSGDSVGYVLNCENYKESFEEGETLRFTLTLFGTTIVYFNQFLQALFALGQNGLGKDKARFYISGVRNSRNQPVLGGSNIYMERYQIEKVSDYVNYRLGKFDRDMEQYEIIFRTPLSQKYHGEWLEEFDMQAIMKSVQRRLYILNAFEGRDEEDFYKTYYPMPEIISQQVRPVSVMRYSNRRDQKMPLRGIKGSFTVGRLPEEVLPLLIAGELLHIGKNTSFGFGRYKIKDL